MVTIEEGDVFKSDIAPTFKVVKENSRYYNILIYDVLGHDKASFLTKAEAEEYLKDFQYKKGGWVAIPKGRYYPFDPDPESIDVKDLAQSLSYTYRFRALFTTPNGFPISVARHCINMSYIPKDKKVALAYLLHDGIEAYISDIPKPLKDDLLDVKRVEELGLKALAYKFDIDFDNPQLHEDDSLMAKDELFYMSRETLYQWAPNYIPKFIKTTKSLEYSPAEDKAEFLFRFSTLTSR